ncbi:hypothetical protein GCM10027578_40580 [Spirosoma luteolum]
MITHWGFPEVLFPAARSDFTAGNKTPRTDAGQTSAGPVGIDRPAGEGAGGREASGGLLGLAPEGHFGLLQE